MARHSLCAGELGRVERRWLHLQGVYGCEQEEIPGWDLPRGEGTEDSTDQFEKAKPENQESTLEEIKKDLAIAFQSGEGAVKEECDEDQEQVQEHEKDNEHDHWQPEPGLDQDQDPGLGTDGVKA